MILIQVERRALMKKLLMNYITYNFDLEFFQ